jgi:hypothetical protein
VAEKLGARKDGQWKIVGLLPDLCKTPGVVPPVPYPVTANLSGTVTYVPSVKLSMGEAFVYDGSKVPLTLGDQAGILKGIKSQTVGADCWPKPGNHSPDVKVGSRFLVREGDMFFMNGGFRGDVGDPKIEKAKRYECRKEQIKAGKASKDKSVQEAANRFEKNVRGAVHAEAADAAYLKPGEEMPVGLLDKTGDPNALKQNGLKPELMNPENSDFRARLIQPDPAVYGNDFKPIVALKGTTSAQDWSNNFQHAAGFDAPYYKTSSQVATALRESGSGVHVVGHSLGGSMAAVVSRISGLSATTFNAAPVNPNVFALNGVNPIIPKVESVIAYQVEGESLSLLSGQLGTLHKLPGNSVFRHVRHSMGEVKQGLEKQKTADQKIIASATGVKC